MKFHTAFLPLYLNSFMFISTWKCDFKPSDWYTII